MTNHIWFITGVSSGLGRHLAEQLLERGDRVAGTARRMDAVVDLATRYTDRFWSRPLDLTDTPAIRRVANEAFAHFGRIEVIVNNAGYGLVRRGGRSHRRTDPPPVRHQCNRLDPGSSSGIAPSAHAGRRPHPAALQHGRSVGDAGVAASFISPSAMRGSSPGLKYGLARRPGGGNSNPSSF
jgi:NAD(P)-dependent dehydrogenase (short-subunit alcohol dehydrogenase family)